MKPINDEKVWDVWVELSNEILTNVPYGVYSEVQNELSTKVYDEIRGEGFDLVLTEIRLNKNGTNKR